MTHQTNFQALTEEEVAIVLEYAYPVESPGVKGAMALGLITPEALDISNYNVPGIIEEVRRAALEYADIPGHLIATTDYPAYRKHCAKALINAIPRHLNADIPPVAIHPQPLDMFPTNLTTGEES